MFRVRYACVLAVALMTSCIAPTVMKTSNVTVPVMYGHVHEIGAEPAVLTDLKSGFSAKAESMLSVSVEENEYYSETTTYSQFEGANKFDAAILTAQGTCHQCAVQVHNVKVGAYHSFLIAGLIEANWVRIDGGIYNYE